ncbi:MAG: NAD-dependent epimerase/dehydratase family protein [Prolixibacteraceae bacterium]|jgi:nucleoside-diphosphate-sugar epimerase|nr:NAD-dependent epimerase/dehydratase family protein [Prolixibacteraceae bacterium]
MIFVTGGTGLIGSHLLFELVSAGKNVTALRRETSDILQVLKTFSLYSDDPEELFGRINWVKGDILDYFNLQKLTAGVKEVYHCAAIVSFKMGERKEMIANNVEGTANIVNACLENKISKICHVSSVSALGKAQDGSLTDELTNWIPSKKVSGYSESKFFSEMEIWRGIEEGLDAVIVNPSVVLGPGKWSSGSSQFFKAVWEGLRFYTKGATGFVDVKDVVRAMIMLMEDTNFEQFKNQRFLLNSENMSYQELFNQIADVFGKTRPQYFASPFLLSLAWRLSALINKVYKKIPAVTYETATAGNSINKFNGNKITRTLNFEYIPVTTSIRQTSEFFMHEKSVKESGCEKPFSGLNWD